METNATNDYKNQMKGKSPLMAVNEAVKQGQATIERHFPKENTFKKISNKTVEAYDTSISAIRRNPITSIAVALAVGATAGYLLKRR